MAIYINTNQNVQLKYEISSIGDRLIAYLIDLLVMGGIGALVLFFASLMEGDIVALLFFGVLFFYHLICEITMNGQSFGKRNKGIRVIKKDGNAATISSYLLRFLLLPIDSIYGLGLAVIFFTEKGQRLGDLAAGTIVVNVKDENEIKASIRDEMSFMDDGDIIFNGAGILSDKEIQVIRTVLSNRKEEPYHDNILLLGQKIREKLNVEKGERNDLEFLKQIVQDYYKLHQE